MIELLLEAERALSMGRADRAEVLYQQVAASDPRNSIAVVGLARVALERSDDAGALVLARRALSIDGENVAAQRLVQRLEEVLQTRGEALPPAEAPPETRPGAPTDATLVTPTEDKAVADTAAGTPPRSTPFDGPDPVLGAADPDAPGTGPGGAPSSKPTERRSLLDRLRGR